MRLQNSLVNFNSHAHVERDTVKTIQHNLNDNFNSHAHVERDIANERGRNTMPISTHTLTWSVTISVLIL